MRPPGVVISLPSLTPDSTGVAIGVWISGGYSGGHLNPAVTLSFAVFRDFPYKKVPIYWLAQLLGAICGAGITYANYIHPIDIVEGGRGIRTVPGTASLFATYAVSSESWFSRNLRR